MREASFQELQGLGLDIGAVSISHLPELKAEFGTLSDEGILSSGMYDYLMNHMLFNASDHPEGAQSVLIIAIPAPIGVLLFNHEGKKTEALIPPTYMDYVKVPPALEARLNAVLGKHGYHANRCWDLPAKLLAARSGLAEYGRNNICYVKGMGSFVFLSTFTTDMPCEDGWREARRMELCDKCRRCADNCPTGVIDLHRRVIDASRCLTMHNEAGSSVPFPDWIAPGAHNAIIGCLRCQLCCPQNKDVLGMKSEPVEFDEIETAMLLDGKPIAELPASLTAKMQRVAMDEYYEPVARNLKALLMPRS